MSENGFRKFLEYESRKNPLKIKDRINKDEVLKEAKLLASRIIDEDIKLIRKFWEDKNYGLIAFVLRKYGLEFKGIIYTEDLIKEFDRIIKEHQDFQKSTEKSISG